MQFEKTATENIEKDDLAIYKAKGKAHAPEYIALTKDFYLKM